MLPQIVEAQSFLNTGDLSWSILLHSPGDCPPQGEFRAHMCKDPAGDVIDMVFSEARGNLLRGSPDLAQQRIPLTFIAPAAALSGFLGAYTVDLYYLRDGATKAVMRGQFDFTEGA